MTKLQQILQNLLSNAIKFTPEGGRVLLKAEPEGPNVVLTVTDTGVGIAAEEQELIFEKFRQSGNPLTREHAGTGLGLSIVRELSKLLGGDVTLQSELGRGSTFTVRLPLLLSEEPRWSSTWPTSGSTCRRRSAWTCGCTPAPCRRRSRPAWIARRRRWWSCQRIRRRRWAGWARGPGRCRRSPMAMAKRLARETATEFALALPESDAAPTSPSR